MGNKEEVNLTLDPVIVLLLRESGNMSGTVNRILRKYQHEIVKSSHN